jgi:hypothetical protein
MRVSSIAAVAGFTIIVAGSVLADGPTPHQKPGLWESSMTMAGKPFTTQSCVTEESEAKMSVFSAGVRQKNCSSSSITHNMDGSWTSTSTCQFGSGAARTTHAHLVGDLNSKVTIAVEREGSNTPEMTMTMTWMGPCAPGMKGGDVIMSNGMKMNIIDGTMSGMPSH